MSNPKQRVRGPKPPVPMSDTERALRKEVRKLRKALETSTNNALIFGARLDAIMQTPTSKERGSAVSKLLNELDVANDLIRYGELGVDFRTDNKRAVLRKLSQAGSNALVPQQGHAPEAHPSGSTSGSR